MSSKSQVTRADRLSAIRRCGYPTKFALLKVFLLVSAIGALGQSDLGTITGTLTDQTGAVVPSAKLTAVNVGTGITMSTQSTDAGLYSFPALQPGTYRVEVTRSGFKSLTRDNVVVEAARVAGLNLTLQVGEVSETVDVTTASPILETEAATTGMLVDQNEYVNLPLSSANNGRLSDGFLVLVPGYSGTPGGFSDSINGAQASTREIELEGGSTITMEIAGDGRNITFPPDAVDQMSVLTSSYAAEYGTTGGGVEVYEIKSGTNQLHGDAYEFLRNEDFDSRGYFNLVRPVHRENEFGGTIGGPFLLPKLYDGRNRSFFFYAFNGYTFRNVNTTSILSVPTQAFRNGNFSDLLTGTSPRQLYDPSTTSQLSSGTYTRQPFSGNIIPTNRIDPTAQKIMALYPLPNLPGDFNNYAATVPAQVTDRWTNVFKVDQQFSSRNHLSAALSVTTNPSTSGGGLPAPIGSNQIGYFTYWFPRLDWDWTLSPRMLNQLRFIYNRQTQYQDTPFRSGGWPQQLGLLGFQNAVGSFPNISLGSFTQSGMTLGYNGRTSQTFVLSNGLSWTRSKHGMKFGVEARRLMSEKYLGNPAQLTFSPNETASPSQLSTTGLEFASFLLGQVDQAAESLYGNFAPTMNTYQFSFYAQDHYQLTRRLSLDLGLRFDVFTPLTESHNWYSMINTTTPNPFAGNLPGVYIFAGKNGNGNRIAPADKDTRNFGPRFGFAYEVTSKTSLRGGYGISYYQSGPFGSSVNTYLNDGYWITDAARSLNSGITPAFTLAQGFPASQLIVPPFTQQSFGVNSGVVENYWDPTADRLPYSQNWNFNVQRVITPNLMVDVGYVGSKGTRLPVRVDINQLDPKYLTTVSTTLLNSDINSPAVVAAGYRPPYPGFVGTLAQALRPFPQYENMQSGGRSSDTTGNSTYHSFQLSATKRLSHGFDTTLAYTWSKDLTDSSYSFYSNDAINPDKYDRSMGKTFSAFDQPYNLAISFNYDLPFGPGRKLLRSNNLLDNIVGGWRLSGILSYHSGPHLGVTAPQTNPLYNGSIAASAFSAAAIPKYANLVPGVGISPAAGSNFNPRTESWVNINAFSIPTTPFGDTRQYVPGLMGPAYRNENIGLAKDTNLSERVKLEIRGEAYNVLNRVVLGGPATSLGTPQTFGIITSQSNSPRNGQVAAKIIF